MPNVIGSQVLTKDLGGNSKCSEFTAEICRRVQDLDWSCRRWRSHCGTPKVNMSSWQSTAKPTPNWHKLVLFLWSCRETVYPLGGLWIKCVTLVLVLLYKHLRKYCTFLVLRWWDAKGKGGGASAMVTNAVYNLWKMRTFLTSVTSHS